MSDLLRRSALLFALCLALLAQAAHAQVLPIYAVAGTSTTGTRALYVVDTGTGQLTAVSGSLQLPAASTATGFDPLSGRLYAVRRVNATNPTLYYYDPGAGTTGTANTAVSGLPRNILRATACPNGRLYVGAATTALYEIAMNGTLLRTLTLQGLPTGGDGGFSCASNGDFYILANNTNGGANYSLYSITLSALTGGATTLPVTLVGAATTGRTFSALVEGPDGVTGCASPPAPCLVAADTTSRGLWGVNVLTGATTRIGNTSAGATQLYVGDLARNYPAEFSVQQSVKPTTVLQTIGQEVTFTFTIDNSQAVANSVTISDPLTFASFVGTPTWTCEVTGPGDPTSALATACGAASGSGSIATYANFAQDSSVTFTIKGVLATSFTGSYTNVVNLALPSNLQEDPDSPNSATATVHVTPSVNLSIHKTNGTSVLSAGGSTTYVITTANTGLSAANGVTLRDPAVSGLSCTSVTCAVGGGSASCPAPGNLTIANLQGGGIAHNLPVNSSLTFTLQCDVTATGY